MLHWLIELPSEVDPHPHPHPDPDPDPPSNLEVTPLPSWQRVIMHKTARRFGLQSETIGEKGQELRPIRLTRLSYSARSPSLSFLITFKIILLTQLEAAVSLRGAPCSPASFASDSSGFAIRSGRRRTRRGGKEITPLRETRKRRRKGRRWLLTRARSAPFPRPPLPTLLSRLLVVSNSSSLLSTRSLSSFFPAVA